MLQLPFYRPADYQYYYEAISEQSPLLVIRNEHMEDDWNSAEVTLGRSKRRGRKKVTFPQNNVNTDQHAEDYYVSDESKAALCDVLCNEIQFYKRILRRAQNLKEEEIRASLAELAASCPLQAVADECPEPPPDISVKLRENRGYFGMEDAER